MGCGEPCNRGENFDGPQVRGEGRDTCWFASADGNPPPFEIPMADPDDMRRGPSRTAAALVAAGAWAGLVYLARQVPPDGREHGNFGQFLGRLHPLLVHGPVALLVLVPAMELLGLRPRWVHLRAAAGWILAVAVVAAFVAAFDGWLLAWSGGLRGRDVTRHMWGGVWLAGVSAAALWARGGSRPGVSRFIYPPLLLLAFGLMVWTGHGGGAISHGDGFLTEKMPVRMRTWLGLGTEPPQPGTAAAGSAHPAAQKAGPRSTEPGNLAYYAVHIAPLFTRSCVSCHKPEKHKGGLRLDSYEELMHGGDDGPAVVPGDPKSSELLRRVRLPSNDDDSMPSDGDKPLTQQEIQMIDAWIAAGAKSG
jgi:uncharacterized membrane protein